MSLDQIKKDFKLLSEGKLFRKYYLQLNKELKCWALQGKINDLLWNIYL